MKSNLFLFLRLIIFRFRQRCLCGLALAKEKLGVTCMHPHTPFLKDQMCDKVKKARSTNAIGRPCSVNLLYLDIFYTILIYFANDEDTGDHYLVRETMYDAKKT